LAKNFFIKTFPDGGECPAPIVFSFRELQGVEFRLFLQQFLPWILFSDFTAPCLEIIGNAAGKEQN